MLLPECERPRVQRLVVETSLAGSARRVAPLVEQILRLLTSADRPPNAVPMTEAEAFVLTNAFVGVIRAMIMRPDISAPAQAAIEAAMGRLITSYIEYRPSPPADNVHGD